VQDKALHWPGPLNRKFYLVGNLNEFTVDEFTLWGLFVIHILPDMQLGLIISGGFQVMFHGKTRSGVIGCNLLSILGNYPL
jgi:hypothetical protein